MQDKPLLDLSEMPELHRAVVDAALLLVTLAGHGFGAGSCAAAEWLEEVLSEYGSPSFH